MGFASETTGPKSAGPRRFYADTVENFAECPELASESEALAQTLDQLVQGFSEQVAVANEDWTILAVNDAWRRMIRIAGYPELIPGTNYRDFLKTFAVKGHQNAIAVLNGVNAIEAGETNAFQLTYGGVDQWEGRTLQLRINRLHLDGRTLVTITRQDITASAELHRLREQFSSSVLEQQAEERRRFARELHDSTAQLLALMGLLLGTLKRKSPSADSLGLVEELQGLVRDAQGEIRAISYLAHPPVLEKMGLAAAIKALVEGFAGRSALPVSFEQQGKGVRLSPVAERAFYRVAQEALANTFRHAKASHVRVCLIFKKSIAHLAVIDDGIGISRKTLAGAGRAGVGMSGMRSRLTEIGGRLSVRQLRPGTAVCASIPSGHWPK